MIICICKAESSREQSQIVALKYFAYVGIPSAQDQALELTHSTLPTFGLGFYTRPTPPLFFVLFRRSWANWSKSARVPPCLLALTASSLIALLFFLVRTFVPSKSPLMPSHHPHKKIPQPRSGHRRAADPFFLLFLSLSLSHYFNHYEPAYHHNIHFPLSFYQIYESIPGFWFLRIHWFGPIFKAKHKRQHSFSSERKDAENRIPLHSSLILLTLFLAYNFYLSNPESSHSNSNVRIAYFIVCVRFKSKRPFVNALLLTPPHKHPPLGAIVFLCSAIFLIQFSLSPPNFFYSASNPRAPPHLEIFHPAFTCLENPHSYLYHISPCFILP